MMNQQKKNMILKQVQQSLVEQNMDLNQLVMLMSDKGFNDPTVQEFIRLSNMVVSKNEFEEVREELVKMTNKRREDAENKKIKDTAEKEKVNAPSFDEIVNKGKDNVVTNDNDLLTKIKQGKRLPTEDYSDSSSGVSYTIAVLPNEPSPEEVQLPSKGRFYKGIIADKEGKLLVRPMTLKEEKIFSTERLLKTGQAIDMVFRNCIKTPGIDTTELLSADRIFLLFYLRGISYGSKYPIALKCNNCNNEIEYEIDIADLEIKSPPKELEEPFFMTLPISEYKVTLRLSRGKDESRMIKYAFAPKKHNEVNETLTKRLLNLMIDIEGIPKEQWEEKIENLVGRDISHIRQTMELIDFGYNLDEFISCDNCGSSVKIELAVNENFFRTS